MDLSPEDDLRLNVLLANNVQAIRIDESTPTIYALSDRGEAKVRLNPNCRVDAYLRRVREALSGHILGSPGGYPIFLRRWTHIGDITATNLRGLLLLGEPEAVVAVVRSPGLTVELARRAWWALPNAENARRMLERPHIAQSDLAPQLADFLVEFLPFEENPADTIDSVRLVLQPGLIGPETRKRLWTMGARKNALRVGFLAAVPDDLPDPVPGRADADSIIEALAPLVAAGNAIAQLINRVVGGSGQTFLRTAEDVLHKPATQEVVWKLLNVFRDYFASARCGPIGCQSATAIVDQERQRVTQAVNGGSAPAYLKAVIETVPALRREVEAMLILARVDEAIVTPIFARSTAVGSVMRHQIEPVIAPLFQQLAALRGRTV